MVNTGHPSAGCELCRQRKIKCDEERPACRKCTKYGRTCPGYRDLSVVTLQKKTKPTKKTLWQQPKAARSAPSDLGGHQDRPSETETVAPTSGSFYSPTPSPQASSCWPSRPSRSVSPFNGSQSPVSLTNYGTLDSAVHELFTSPAFIACALIDPDLDSIGIIEHIYYNTLEGSCLHVSVRAAALVHTSYRTGRHSLIVQAQDQYCKALETLRMTLENPSHQLEDETLLSVLMMRYCEFTLALHSDSSVAEAKGGFSETWLAHSGAVAILKMRGMEQLFTPEGRWLFEMTARTKVSQMWSLRVQDPVLCQLEDQSDLAQPQWLYPIVSFYRYYFRSSLVIRAKIQQTCEAAESWSPQWSLAEMHRQLQTADELEEHLQTWEDKYSNFEAKWVDPSVQMILQERLGYPAATILTYYDSHKVCLRQTRLLFAQIKLQESIVEGLSTLVETLERKQAQSHVPLTTSSTFAAVDKLVVKHLQLLQQRVDRLISLTSHRFGDVDTQGKLCTRFQTCLDYDITISPDAFASEFVDDTLPMIEVSIADDMMRVGEDYGLVWPDDEKHVQHQRSQHDPVQRLNVPTKMNDVESYTHLMHLQKCPYLCEEQVGVLDWAVSRAREELRGS